MRKKLIAGIGSNIGCALAEHCLRKGHGVAGTFLNKTAKIEAFSQKPDQLSYCDFKVKKSKSNCLG